MGEIIWQGARMTMENVVPTLRPECSSVMSTPEETIEGEEESKEI